MRQWLTAISAGALSSAAATLLHLQLPPFGLILALIGSATTIWALMQKTGKRRYPIVAALIWIALAWRAALPGAGGELLVQGDLAGEVLVVAGSLLVLVTASISQSK